ncbi:MAG: RNA 2'-phosphotransferase [Chloroflexi bacterium]|nr:RNA 2'-phosphotransferase [Chloroflexota bacterium]
MGLDYKRLSKTIARALRHAPEQFGLELDAEGWTPVEDLLAALRGRNPAWAHLTEDDLHQMMASATKQRYELCEGRIRALYGHSVSERVEKEAVEPPAFLYHGTSPHAAELILQDGLRPMRRQFVHLSTDEATARMVGQRKAPQPVILKIQAGEAHRAGVAFYHGNEDIWLADSIPPQFIATL